MGDVVGRIEKDEEGFLWIIRNNSEFDGCNQDMVSADLYHEKEFLDCVRKYADKNTIFIDVGAHTGYYGVRLCKEFDSVIAIEPNAYNSALLKVNFNINECNNYTVFSVALGKEKGDSIVYNRGSVSFLEEVKSGYSEVDVIEKSSQVNVDTLDNLMYYDDLKYIMKIDTEGMELDILKGGEYFLTHQKVLLLIEYHNNVINGSKDNIISYLTGLGYKIVEQSMQYDDKMFLSNRDDIE